MAKTELKKTELKKFGKGLKWGVFVNLKKTGTGAKNGKNRAKENRA